MDYTLETTRLFKILKDLTAKEDIIKIRNELVTVNLRLVTHILNKHKPWNDDRFQVGCLGLILAVNTYDVDRGTPFSSWACFCIERELHQDWLKTKHQFEGHGNGISLDDTTTLGNGDEVANHELIDDKKLLEDLDSYINENEFSYMCDNIIKPSIQEIAASGAHMLNAVDLDLWQQLEFLYIMDLIFIDSQKQRFNITQMAAKLQRSVQNTRVRHERTMDLIFKRMWEYMNLSFSELLLRLRGNKKIPKKLLCLDPGKTTGWSLFENGILTQTGQLEDCYDDDNVNASIMLELLKQQAPDFIVYEDYKVYAHKLEQHTFNPVFTVRLIGVIEAYCAMNNVPSHKQMATTAKTFVTDEKLTSWNLWQKGHKHSRDSIRHGCYFLLFYKKGQDIA